MQKVREETQRKVNRKMPIIVNQNQQVHDDSFVAEVSGERVRGIADTTERLRRVLSRQPARTIALLRGGARESDAGQITKREFLLTLSADGCPAT